MLFIGINFVKSNHNGVYPDYEFMSIFEIIILILCALWQLLGVYGLVQLDEKS